MLLSLREVETGLATRGERDGVDYSSELKKVCAEWTIQARYSPRTMPMAEAREMLKRVEMLKDMLK